MMQLRTLIRPAISLIKHCISTHLEVQELCEHIKTTQTTLRRVSVKRRGNAPTRHHCNLKMQIKKVTLRTRGAP